MVMAVLQVFLVVLQVLPEAPVVMAALQVLQEGLVV